MTASQVIPGMILNHYGDLYQVCSKPLHGRVWVIKENGMLDVISFSHCERFTRFKDLIEEGQGDCLKHFFIPKSWLD